MADPDPRRLQGGRVKLPWPSLAPRSRVSPHRGFNLTAWFAVLSLLCIGAVTVTSSILLSRFLTTNLLMHDALVTMEVVQSIVEVQGARDYFVGGKRPGGDRSLEEFVAHVAKLPDVLRANIYARDQRVLWSSDATLIGRVLGPNPELEEALKGEVAIESGIIGSTGDPKPEHLALRSDEPRFVELYLPVRTTNGGEVIGVVEVYKVPTRLFQTIARGVQMIWAFALVGGVLLYVALYWMIRRADRIIDEQSTRLLETETLAVIGEMTGAITHGIRNPLASIRSSAELCQDHPSPDVRELARDVVTEVDRLSEWVRQLLTYADERPPDIEPVALEPLLANCLGGFERDMQRRGVKLETAIDPDLPRVRAERVRLGHVMNSLLANALEAMPEGGELHVAATLARKRRVVEVSIRDTGVGIARDALPRVFAPFFTTKRKGLGLGLPLVKRIVTRFGGAVWVTSAPDEGTEVTLRLPVQDE